MPWTSSSPRADSVLTSAKRLLPSPVRGSVRTSILRVSSSMRRFEHSERSENTWTAPVDRPSPSMMGEMWTTMGTRWPSLW